ncbi:class II glutamine amidotransferase [Modestobacter sp. VKM Ac-2978]|uniref:class II glutamine amidotransferase n=1 Tax=Modestobacter sp. VKM Ac-2978 TaxID=3004132 RepID=UPI0022AA64DD|nr:class II glutamine amidotransferase [Modestobacter sp. VKM Ac-2978]MCZ2850301.1 class II glutamine amidotransferase [Modestobacter sp. VKM Ac-2978]
MCRLLGYVAETPVSAVDGLGRTDFDTFTSLSAVHGDGWGMAWRDQASHTTRAATSPISAAADPTYTALADRALGTAGLVHLRWATDGLAVGAENTHPFTDGDHALAHNGSISPIDELEALLGEDARAQLVGDTDSERYFRLVLQCIEETADERAGVARAVGMLRSHFPQSSLNALFLTPARLYAVHVNSRAATPLDDLRQVFGSDDAMPRGHATAYFDMAYKVSATAVHVISSGLPDEGWTPVPPDSVLAIDLTTRVIDVLDPVPAEPAQ